MTSTTKKNFNKYPGSLGIKLVGLDRVTGLHYRHKIEEDQTLIEKKEDEFSSRKNYHQWLIFTNNSILKKELASIIHYLKTTFTKEIQDADLDYKTTTIYHDLEDLNNTEECGLICRKGQHIQIQIQTHWLITKMLLPKVFKPVTCESSKRNLSKQSVVVCIW